MIIPSVLAAAFLQTHAQKAPKLFAIAEGFSVAPPPNSTFANSIKESKIIGWTGFTEQIKFVATVEGGDTRGFPDQVFLNAAVHNIAYETKAKVTSQSEFLLSGWMGLAFTAKSQTRNIVGRLYLVNGRVVTLLEESEKPLRAVDAAPFIESLHLAPSIPAGSHVQSEINAPAPGPIDIVGGITVQFPSKAMLQSTKEGPNEKFWVALNNGATYLAMVETDSPADKLSDDIALSVSLAKLIGGVHASLTQVSDVLLHGWSGLEFQAKIEPFVAWGRTFRVNHSVVSVLVESGEETFPPGCRRFLDSLKIPDSSLGPYLAPGPSFKTYELKDLAIRASFPSEPLRSTPTLGTGRFAVPAIAYQSVYGNRLYRVLSRDLPAAVLNGGSKTDFDSMLAFMANALTGELRVKELRRSQFVAYGRQTMSVEFVSEDRIMAGRFEVSFKDNRMLFVIAQVPFALYPSEEVSKFFGSIQALAPVAGK